MDLMEKIGYLKGLLDGLDYDENSKEGKIYGTIADILEDMADEIGQLDDSISELDELTDILDEDLGSLEDDFYEDEDECDGNCEDCPECDECDGCCFDDEDEDEVLYEVVCPKCGDTVCINEPILEEGKMPCPNCGEELEFTLDDEDGSEE